MVEPNLADPSKKTEVPSGPHLLPPERPSGQPGDPAQTRDKSEADPLIPVTAPAATGPDTGTALAATTSRRDAFARRSGNKGNATHNKAKRTHEEKKEKHRLRVIAKAAAATAAGTSSADDEDGDDDDDGDKHSKDNHSDEDSDADDASEQDVDAPLTAQPTASRTEPVPTPGKKAPPASSRNHPPSHGGGASPGRPSHPFAALDAAAQASRGMNKMIDWAMPACSQ